MRWQQELGFILRRLIYRRRAEREIDEEIRTHLEMEIEQNVADGMSPGEARLAARRSFGSVALAKENSRITWGFRSLETLWQDLRYGLRTMLKNPGFNLIAILTLAFGIGANTAIFSVVNGILLRPLAFEDPDRLVMVWTYETRVSGGGLSGSSAPDFREWRARNVVFDDLAAAFWRDINLTGEGEPERVSGAFVTTNIFQLLGVEPQMGRKFTSAEEEWGEHRVVLLSQGLWQSRFAADPGIVGKTMMEQRLSESLGEQRFNTLLLAIFAMVALVLAAIGIYGVISYSIVQRTHEIGVRMALGAPASSILKLVLSQSLAITLLGATVGLSGAWGLTRFLANLLFGVNPTDAVIFSGMPLLLIVVALLASYIPARRATKLDPTIALRCE